MYCTCVVWFRSVFTVKRIFVFVPANAHPLPELWCKRRGLRKREVFYLTPWRTLKGGISTRTRWKHLCNLRQPTLRIARSLDKLPVSKSRCIAELGVLDLFLFKGARYLTFEGRRSSCMKDFAVASPCFPTWKLHWQVVFFSRKAALWLCFGISSSSEFFCFEIKSILHFLVASFLWNNYNCALAYDCASTSRQ